MDEYLKVPCDDCGRILPKNELQRWEEDLVVGRTSARYASGAPNERTQHKIKHLLLCSTCAGARQAAIDLERAAQAIRDAAARRRARTMALIVVGLIVLFVVSLGIISKCSTPPGAAVSSEGAPASAIPPTLSDVSASSSASGAPETTIVASVPEPVPAAPPPSPPNPAPEDSTDQGLESIDSISSVRTPPLRMAIRHALDTGEATRWQTSDGAISGTVVVSRPQVSERQVCRTYRFTAQSRSDGRTAPDEVACRREGHEWDFPHTGEAPLF